MCEFTVAKGEVQFLFCPEILEYDKENNNGEHGVGIEFSIGGHGIMYRYVKAHSNYMRKLNNVTDVDGIVLSGSAVSAALRPSDFWDNRERRIYKHLTKEELFKALSESKYGVQLARMLLT